ncbi:MAG: RpoL/Rpb11 RNA polymerase subunit family protein [Halobacteria archaeon]
MSAEAVRVEVTEQKNQGVLTFDREGYTLLNLLRTEILRDERVEAANYRVDPATGRKSTFTVVAKSKPLEAVSKAAGRIAERCDELLGLLKK